MQTVRDTVNESMGSAIPLFYPIALLNKDQALRQTFFDPEKGIALAGFRREVANFGVLLAMAQYGPNNEVKASKFDYKTTTCQYHYLKKDFVETTTGLLGSDAEDGRRENVTADVAKRRIDTIHQKAQMMFEVDLVPNAFRQFFKSAEKHVGENKSDRKVNLDFTASGSLPKGTALGKATKDNNGNVCFVTKMRNKQGAVKQIVSYVKDGYTQVPIAKIRAGLPYIIKPIHYNKQTGERFVSVLRPYKSGIRTAIQHFKMGLIRPGDPGYSVTPNRSNGIIPEAVMDTNFLPSQDQRLLRGAPMLSFDYDMFDALMHTLSGYRVVKMKWRNANTGVYFWAEGNEHMPNIEAVMGPTIQSVRGRVWTP